MRNTYPQHRFVPPRTSWSERKRELRRPENKQIESAVATHSWWALLGIRSRVTKYWLAVMCRFFAQFHRCNWNRQRWWTPISMHVVVKWIVIMPRFPSDVLRPQKDLRSNLRASIFQAFGYKYRYRLEQCNSAYDRTVFFFVSMQDQRQHIFALKAYNFSATSRLHACFLLIAAPPLKVFRCPWGDYFDYIVFALCIRVHILQTHATITKSSPHTHSHLNIWPEHVRCLAVTISTRSWL